MSAADLASYAITGSRPIWPLLLVLGLLLLLVTGLVAAQVTDPDRKRRAAEQQGLLTDTPADALPPAEAPQDEADAPEADTPEQERNSD